MIDLTQREELITFAKENASEYCTLTTEHEISQTVSGRETFARSITVKKYDDKVSKFFRIVFPSADMWGGCWLENGNLTATGKVGKELSSIFVSEYEDARMALAGFVY